MGSTTAALRGNIVDTLIQRATIAPDAAAFAWRSDDLSSQQLLTYGELLARAKAIAADLQGRCRLAERVVLVFPHGLEFTQSFFGCLYAGLIAVPICPPRRLRPAPGVDRIVANAEPAVVLSTAEYVANHVEWFQEIPTLLQQSWLNVDRLAAGGDFWAKPPIDSNTLAFLQYTSGTTGTPKGVMVSHGNLVHNAATIRDVVGPGDHRQRAFWLPMYHDLGLIGAMLQTVFDGATSTWISPSTFLRRPLSWLGLISRTGASLSAAPDFAYNLCAEKCTAQMQDGLDLSHWTAAISGAETIRPATIERFSRAFAPCGFRKDAFQPGYGLAEATLVVSCLPKDLPPVTVCVDGPAMAGDGIKLSAADAPEARVVASSGQVGASQQVAIVDPDTGLPCRAGRVGEIWVCGPNVAQGYYNDERATAQRFHAKLPGDDRCYLRTGDLGFLLDGHLYVAGRLKELIVIRGRNVYPQDIESAIRECDIRLRTAVNSAFSVDLLGCERLVVIQEFGRTHRNTDFDELGQKIRLAIGRECGVEVFDLLFVRKGSIPRTTSGKVRRIQCREEYLAERFEPVARWTDRQSDVNEATRPNTGDQGKPDQARSVDRIRDWLLERISQRLDVPAERLDEHQAFTEMGLGSLDVVLICTQFEEWLGERLPPTTIYNYPTIAALAERLGQSGEPQHISSFSADAENDPLRREIERLSDHELEAFIAEEMVKFSSKTYGRAA